MKRFRAVYTRYGRNVTEEYDDLNEAIDALQIGAEHGELFALGIYDGEREGVYLPQGDYPAYEMFTHAQSLPTTPTVLGNFATLPEDEEGDG